MSQALAPVPSASSPDWLAGLASRLGADRAIWKPLGGPALASPRLDPKDIDWARVERLAPGSVRRDGWASSPRSRRSSQRILWVRARVPWRPDALRREGEPLGPPGSGLGPGVLGLGVLRSRAPRPFETWPEEALLELAACGPAERPPTGGPRPDPLQPSLVQLGVKAGGLLHDLRNQLTLASLIGRALAEDPAGGGLAELLEQLELARDLSANSLTGELDPLRRCPVRPVLVREVRSALRGSRRALEPPPRPLVKCDGELTWGTRPSALGRLVRNLVLNALEASYAGGTVRVWASEVEGNLHVVVEDEGRGMGPGQLRQLFEAGRSETEGGTGFGTASLRSCLEELDGRIEVHSSRGSGTRVRLVLPELGVQPVLVVDPDARRRATTCAAWNDRGLPVVACATPARGLELLARHVPSRVLVARGCPPGAPTASAPTQLAELRRRAFESSIPVRMPGAGPYSGAAIVERT